MTQHDIVHRMVLRYHLVSERASLSGYIGFELELILNGRLKIGDDARLYVTPAGQRFLDLETDAASETPKADVQ